MKKLVLASGDIVKLDDEDYENLKDIDWHIYEKNGYKDIRFRQNGRALSMRRVITKAKENTRISHINGDYLDLQKANLRFPEKPTDRKNKEKYEVRYISQRNNKYRARPYVNGQKYEIGTFQTLEQAEKALEIFFKSKAICEQKKAVDQNGQRDRHVVHTSQNIVPQNKFSINPLRLSGGALSAAGVSFGLFGAASMDAGATVNVIGVLVVAGIALVLAGGSLLFASRKIKEAKEDHELAEMIRGTK